MAVILRYFLVGSSPSLNFLAITLLSISHKHFQEDFSGINSLNKKSPKEKYIYHGY